MTQRIFWPAAALALALLAACSGKDAAPGGAPGGGMPPPPAVGVITVAPATVALQTELPGRVEPLRVAQVRARVNGVVLKREFREGAEVRAGQLLYQIDPAPYQAALDSALAQLARAEASLAQTRATALRYAPLAAAKAISEQDYVNAQAAQQAAAADVAAGRAAVQSARINLGYARVTAPIDGRIGRALVTEGALVSATSATELATIQQIGRVYVDFTQSSNDLLRLRKSVAGGASHAGDAGLPVEVLLDDGSVLAQRGRLLFTDLTVDASTGQVMLRAEVPNPDRLLLPGQYVRVRLAQSQLPAAVLLPQQAVTRSNQGDSVLVVGDGNKPAPRKVTIVGAQDGQWVVSSGLKAGEQVIVDGFQKMFVPGAPVKPVPWQPPSAASAPARSVGVGVELSGRPACRASSSTVRSSRG